MFISIIVPAYNEEKSIKKSIHEILSFIEQRSIEGEIIVVDDGSQDRTTLLVKEISNENSNVQIISLEKNQGKGFAVKTGILAARGDICGFTDADGASPIEGLDRVLPLFDEEVDIVIGSRAKFSEETKVQVLLYRKIIGRIFNFILGLLISVYDRHGKKVADTQCGFKWFRRKVGQEIFSQTKIKGFAFDVEVLFLANRFQFKIEELPINWVEKGDSRVNLMVDPVKMFWQVATIRFLHRGLTR